MLSRVYAILDETSIRARALPFRSVARGLLRAQPRALQYRAKGIESSVVLSALRELLALRDELSPGTLVYMNDLADLAAQAGADGVHVGQGDLSVSAVRASFPALLVGVSTHNQRELERALGERPDYVAIGPVFATSSKANPEPLVTLPELTQLSQFARNVGVPVVAIGGITRDRAPELAPWVEQVAVIAELLEGAEGASAEDRVFENARALDAAMLALP